MAFHLSTILQVLRQGLRQKHGDIYKSSLHNQFTQMYSLSSIMPFLILVLSLQSINDF